MSGQRLANYFCDSVRVPRPVAGSKFAFSTSLAISEAPGAVMQRCVARLARCMGSRSPPGAILASILDPKRSILGCDFLLSSGVRISSFFFLCFACFSLCNVVFGSWHAKGAHAIRTVKYSTKCGCCEVHVLLSFVVVLSETRSESIKAGCKKQAKHRQNLAFFHSPGKHHKDIGQRFQGARHKYNLIPTAPRPNRILTHG